MNPSALIHANEAATLAVDRPALGNEHPHPSVHSVSPAPAPWTGNQSRLRRLPLQRKIAIGSVHDPLEAEADHAADHVLHTGMPPTTTPVTARLTRKCAHCEEEDKQLNTKSANPATGEAPAIVRDVITSPGQPLDPATRSFFEPRFGQDFSGVRIHTGTLASQSAHQVNALAYTVGPHIAFADGQFSPHAHEGRRLIAHELAHVVQQSAGGSSPSAAHETDAEHAATRVEAGQPASVHTSSAPGIARQPAPPHPALTQALSWDDLFEKVISDQRAFLFTGPADVAHPAVDPAGVGRGVGPDRTLRGTEVLAAIQIVDHDGNRVAIGFGAHRLLSGGHAEEQALAGLRRELAGHPDVSGGRMMVVVDQYPCGPHRHGCGLQLRQFAQEHGLELEVRVPLRERVNQPGVNASPRTASRGAFRTDLAQDPRTQFHLETVDQQPAPHGAPHGGGAGPHGGGGGGGDDGGGGGHSGAHDTAGANDSHGTGSHQTSTPTFADVPHVNVTGATSATRALSKEALTIVIELENQTRSAIALTNRIRVYSSVFTHLLAAADMINAITNAQSMAADGTLFGDTQRLAEQIEKHSEEAKTDAEAIDDSFSVIGVSTQIDAADKQQDDDTLDTFGTRLLQFAESLNGSIKEYDFYASGFTARADAMQKIAEFYKKAVSVPQGVGTVANAEEFDMYVSFDKLHSPVAAAGENFTYAAALLHGKQDFARALAYRANRAYWSIRLNRLAVEVNRRTQAQQSVPPPGGSTPTTPAARPAKP